jgi:Na+/proline symporter/signal transduction histidine kinase/CheY-like chemotaxis protein
MEFVNVDSVLVLGYLAFTLYIGIGYGKGTKSIESFALGGRNFSTSALVATVTATYVSGSSFVIGITQGYQDGLLKFFASSGTVCAIFMTAFIFIPRMGEFLGDFSIAESMRKMFGSKVGVITACSGIMISVGFVAMQLKIVGDLLAYFSNISTHYSLMTCAAVMIIYCLHGGIKGVIFTDILQFVTFMIVVPSIAISIWFNVRDTNPNAYGDFITKIVSLESTSGTDYLTLFLYFLIPSFSAPFFQRITASKTTQQATDAFWHSAYLYFVYIFIAAITGILLFVYKGTLAKTAIFPFMLDQFTFPGLKGLTFIAIIAMAMSTADSHLNTFAVMFTHDICKQLGFVSDNKSELRIAQISTVLIGILAAVLALYAKDLIDLLLFSRNFYEPLVVPPLLLAILGFRSSSFSVLTGMAFGFGTVIVWKSVQYFAPGVLKMDSLIPATCMNFIAYASAHYLFKQPGGWVGPKDTTSLELSRQKSRAFRAKICTEISDFFQTLFFSLQAPVNLRGAPAMHALLGILVVASYFTVAISNPALSQQCADVYILQFLSCGVGALLIAYPLWNTFISERFRNALTLYSLLYLIYASMILMLAHGFSSISIVGFLINILVVGFFGRVVTTMMIAAFGSLIGISKYIGSGYIIVFTGTDFAFVAAYGTFALAVVLMSFVNRYQNKIESLTESESRLTHLNSMLEGNIVMREENLKKALDMHRDIVRNVNHEIRIPMGALVQNIEFLEIYWKTPSFHERAEEIIPALRENMDRFYRYASNMLDLSLYQEDKMLFDIEPKNFKEFIEKFAEKHDNILLKYAEYAPDIVEFDEVKMLQLLEELVRNSNQFSNGSTIELSVSPHTPLVLNGEEWKQMKVTVKDRGVGVPESELRKIFEPLYISSRTKSTSGGKGMGLAIAAGIVRGHLGDIYITNNEDSGVTVSIILPILHPNSNFLAGNKPVLNEPEKIDLGKIIKDIKVMEEKYRGRIPKVLMIEDERSVLASAKNMIQSLGCEFKGIDYGSDAVEYIMSDDFEADLILLDMMLPDTDGLEIMKKVKDKVEKMKIPVVIQSGLVESERIIQETLKLGAKGFISKPYSVKNFQAMVKKWLGLEG